MVEGGGGWSRTAGDCAGMSHNSIMIRSGVCGFGLGQYRRSKL